MRDHESSQPVGGTMDPVAFADAFERALEQVERVLLGQRPLVRDVLVAMFAGGHVLLEGPPGLGKTLLARSLSRILGLPFRRIQFTPDLMPSDVTGGNVFDQQAEAFVFHPGPVFCSVLLADEINRAPAKTQSSLLEAMSDRQVTIDGTTRALPDPFFVVATQNPIESEGTYPLPEAQLDRFMLKVLVDHPSVEVEVDLLRSVVEGFDAADLDAVELATVLSADQVLSLRAMARQVRVDPELLRYVVEIVSRTRAHPAVDLGASPRASIALLRCSQVLAASQGRAFVVPDDIKELAGSVLRHRFLLQPDAELEGLRPDDVVRALLTDVRVPGGESA